MDRQAAERRGRLAEQVAALYLRIKGYRILQQRLKTPAGEIDLLALRQDTLVLVEIKARQRLNDALQALTFRQQQRIERAAATLLSQYPGKRLRFDLIAVGWRDLRLRHVQEAWRPR